MTDSDMRKLKLSLWKFFFQILSFERISVYLIELNNPEAPGKKEIETGQSIRTKGAIARFSDCEVICFCMHAQSLSSVWLLVECSPLTSSVHGIFQARILEWFAISSSRRTSWLRDLTLISYIDKWILYPSGTWAALFLPRYLPLVLSLYIRSFCTWWNITGPALEPHHLPPIKISN